MSKELEEFYKQYSARISNLDDTPLFETGTFGTFKILSVEEYDDMKDKISNLEKQLAEKEKEIRVVYSFRKQKCDNLQNALAEKERQVKKLNLEAQKYFEDAYCNDFHNQDKISFCIEKIQETKKSLRDKVCLMGNDTHCYLQNAIHWQDVVAIIDNQIASLKKGVE